MDVLTEYSDIILKDKMEEVKTELLQSKEYKEYNRLWSNFKKEKVKNLTDEECELLVKYYFEAFEEVILRISLLDPQRADRAAVQSRVAIQ
jgi:hypothetical protein